MKNLHRNTLIATTAVITISSISLFIFLYAQNRKIKDSLTDLKTRFEASQKQNSGLQEENSALRQQLKDKDTLLDQASQEKAGLENKITSFNEKFSGLKSDNARLQENLRDKESVLLSLQKENKQLKSDNEAKELVIKEFALQDYTQKIDKAEETIIQKTGLDKIKPKDFVRDFNGNEQFLQGCSSLFCTNIILNNSGIKYARVGEWVNAEQAFKDCLSNDPNYKPAKLNLGLVYDKTKTKKEAVDYWLKVYGIKL